MSGPHDRDSTVPEPPSLTRRRLLRLGAAAGASAPLLTACTMPALGGQATVGDRFLIQMTVGNRFEPGGITIPAGATVVWYNAAPIRHTATCNPALAAEGIDMVLPPGAAPWTSGDLYTGQSWQRTFTTPGTYLYFCRYHGPEGMIGTVSVIAS